MEWKVNESEILNFAECVVTCIIYDKIFNSLKMTKKNICILEQVLQGYNIASHLTGIIDIASRCNNIAHKKILNSLIRYGGSLSV